jgi:D-alanine-D-alanine ligase
LSQICEGVFIALHGRPGEDGTIQEDLAKFGLYHNGSLSHSASITINKFETNRILREKGFLVANHAIVLKSDWQTKGLHLSQEICKEFGLPLIAKPADDGCSAAVRKIKSPEELNVYLSAIFRDTTHPSQEICSALNIRITDEMPQKNEILIEQFIDREGATRFLEVTGGMLTHFNENGQIQYEVFEPSESLAESEILSLEEKFLAGQGQNLTPSRFSNDPIEQNRISQAVRNTLESVAKALDVTGYCRIDAFVRIFENGQVETVIIEVNSLPGMTPATCIYHQASINGYKPFEFIREILKFGEKRIS